MPIRAATLIFSLCGALALAGGHPAADARTVLPCASFTSERLPPPAPRVTASPARRFQAINEEVRTAPHRVLFLGDSAVERFPHDAPEVWREYLEQRGVLNAGISGDRAENLLWRLRHGNLAGRAPSLVILLIGGDDPVPGGKPRSPELIAEGIRANLLHLRRRLPATPILLLGLLPRGASPASEQRRRIVAVNRLISGCADRRSVFYADIGGALLDAQGMLTAEVSPDGLHLGAAGYARLAPLLAAMIDNLVGRS
jgi:beta-glucosidase